MDNSARLLQSSKFTPSRCNQLAAGRSPLTRPPGSRQLAGKTHICHGWGRFENPRQGLPKLPVTRHVARSQVENHFTPAPNVIWQQLVSSELMLAAGSIAFMITHTDSTYVECTLNSLTARLNPVCNSTVSESRKLAS